VQLLLVFFFAQESGTKEMSGPIRLAGYALVLLFVCMALTSCSEVEPLETTNATLEGSVTYQGKPVPYALVIVASPTADVGAKTTTADADGKYSMADVPLGAVQIGVNTAPARGMMMGKMMSKQKGASAGSAPQVVDVPEKFSKPSSSGITTNIVEGPNTFNVELK
jgi:hypothetical protein